MKTITIANQKGGVGKTTTSICVMQELRRRGKKVLFIDTDPQGNATTFFNVMTEGEASLSDVLYSKLPIMEAVKHTENGDVVPSDSELKKAENVIENDELRFYHLKNAFKDPEFRKTYEYVIIDTPPAIGVLLKNVLAVTDIVIVPIQESGWSISGLMDFNDAVEKAQQTTNPDLKIDGILKIMVHDNMKKSKEISALAEQLGDKIDSKVYKTGIRECTKCPEALTIYFTPLHEYSPNCTTARDYEDFVTELIGEE